MIAQARKNKDHFEYRSQLILFREGMSQFLDIYRKKCDAANKTYDISQKMLARDLRKNASLAIRRQYYNKIIPTTIIAIKTVPFYLIPFYLLKLILQFVIFTLVSLLKRSKGNSR